MDRKRMEDQLISDEGSRLDVYLDSKNNPTVGIGHKILPKDNLFVGDVITPERRDSIFMQDLQNAIDDCLKLYSSFFVFPEHAQECLCNMMFNMGYTCMSSFTNFTTVVNDPDKDWNDVANFLRDNFHLWYSQVGDRAVRIELIFRAINRNGG